MTGKKEPNARDVEIGARMRERRIAMAMSQETLGDALGVSFQQVQKYEKGTNRISAGRMEALARVLDVPVGYFYGRSTAVDADPSLYGPGFTEDRVPPIAGHPEAASDPEAQRLLAAFSAITDPAIRRHVLNLVDALSRGK